MSTDLEIWEDDDEEIEGETEVDLVAEQAEIAQEIAAATADIAKLSAEALELAAADHDETEASGSALVPSSGTAVAAKRKLAKLRSNAAMTQKVVGEKQAEIRARQEEVKSLMRKQMEIAERALAPIQKFVARLEEGIWMVNLYLGRDEEIVVLHGEGEPAPADEPVAIRQLVLAMDEECAINPDEDGIDSQNIEEFDEWLKADPAHVEQVLPNVKGVVALRPRFKSKEHRDPWKQQQMEDLDARTYFLIRNGDRLYRTWTNFQVGDRLVPTRDEFSNYFFEEHHKYGEKGKRTKIKIPITPGTPAWERAEEKADERQRHFMRVALILQGLVDRTTVFHPLPDTGIGFTNYEHGGKTWKFVSDADMLIDTGRKPFFEWLEEKNEQLQVGMRIVGSFTRTYTRSDPYEEGGRIWPRGAERPPSGERLVIEDQMGKGRFVVRYKRTEKVWTNKWIESEDRPGWGHTGGYVEAKARASCTVYASDRNIIPFDLVSVEEMEVYLGARLDRHAYSHMFPLLRQTIKAKREEAAEEEPFRVMLAGVLARDNKVSVEEAGEQVAALVEWFKLKNKNHRPLIGSEAEQAKAVRMITAEHARRMKAEKRGVRGDVIERLRGVYPDALLIGRRRDGRYLVVTPHADGPYVAKHDHGARGDHKASTEWVLLTKQAITPLTVVYESESLAAWDLHADAAKHLTGPEFDRLYETFMRQVKGDVIAVAWEPSDQEFNAWVYKADAKVDEERMLSGEHKDVDINRVAAGWKRRNKVAYLRNVHDKWEGSTWHQTAPWNTKKPEGGRFGDDENRYVILQQDIAWVTKYEVEKARYRDFDKARGLLQDIRAKVIEGVENQWVARREREEFDKFLEDFNDPELWEGHRKLLTIKYPHSHDHDAHKKDALYSLVTYMVERGIEFDGRTMWDASEHFPPVAWFGAPATWEHYDGDKLTKKREQFPEAIDLPADIRDLLLQVPEPEPDEPDDDDERSDFDDD